MDVLRGKDVFMSSSECWPKCGDARIALPKGSALRWALFFNALATRRRVEVGQMLKSMWHGARSCCGTSVRYGTHSDADIGKPGCLGIVFVHSPLTLRSPPYVRLQCENAAGL